MNFSALTDDAFADAGKEWIEDLHRRVDAYTGPAGVKLRIKGEVVKLHLRLDRLKGMATDEDVIQPMSGGDPK